MHTQTHTCRHTDTHIDTNTYTHTVEHYSPVKKNEIMPFAETSMDREIIILSEARERQVYDITHMWNLKKQHKWTYIQHRNRLTDIENKHGYQIEKEGQG